jgi:non-canonical (house-cleaning) NTP pyrophosphatase
MEHGGDLPDYTVGLEGGVSLQSLHELHAGTPGLGEDMAAVCFAYMAILRVKDTRWGISRTAEFPLPPRITALLRADPPMELGDADDTVFADTTSKQKGGTVGKLTHGLIDRTAYYEHALHLALVPFLHDDQKLF